MHCKREKSIYCFSLSWGKVANAIGTNEFRSHVDLSLCRLRTQQYQDYAPKANVEGICVSSFSIYVTPTSILRFVGVYVSVEPPPNMTILLLRTWVPIGVYAWNNQKGSPASEVVATADRLYHLASIDVAGSRNTQSVDIAQIFAELGWEQYKCVRM